MAADPFVKIFLGFCSK